MKMYKLGTMSSVIKHHYKHLTPTADKKKNYQPKIESRCGISDILINITASTVFITNAYYHQQSRPCILKI